MCMTNAIRALVRKGDCTMKQYRGDMARLISTDVIEQIVGQQALWVSVDGNVHNMVLADEQKMYYVEVTIREKEAKN